MKKKYKTVADLLSDRRRWTKHSSAKNKEGKEVTSRSKQAVCWCMLGGVIKIYDVEEDYHSAIKRLDLATEGFGISIFNDSHTHAEVLKVCIEAKV